MQVINNLSTSLVDKLGGMLTTEFPSRYSLHSVKVFPKQREQGELMGSQTFTHNESNHGYGWYNTA